MALTKAEMAEHLVEKLGLNKKDAKDLVEAFFEEIKHALENGTQVKLSGLAILICAPRVKDLDAIQKRVKISQSKPVVW